MAVVSSSDHAGAGGSVFAMTRLYNLSGLLGAAFFHHREKFQ